ncbi:hypothetical protein ACFFMR_13350 [Micromonospora andamanensis]|uniref:Uncharacterized protein n=1 Tax=Micromonospora andamanensis TaxID=1287068 RepID=A0ABQ4HN54_9ACTN|nr:hypothetical protein [Micromonospora andamanensis]GIJ07070.1 hypothetical protein Van01_02840 [Micromonospora andamanensis]GIJ40412.1 hypothetical protein Vwe01_37370 [Micromonospora andamanensis]
MTRRWVAHLPFTAADLPAARQFAGTLARSLSFLSEVDAGETTVSAEDEQGVRHRVFCDLALTHGRRCGRRAGHDGACAWRTSR